MQQLAIAFNKNNADIVAAGLDDFSASELLEEYDWMLNTHTNLVLCKNVLDDGYSLLSYVVTVDMFEKNAGTIHAVTLNDKTYTFVRNV